MAIGSGKGKGKPSKLGTSRNGSRGGAASIMPKFLTEKPAKPKKPTGKGAFGKGGKR